MYVTGTLCALARPGCLKRRSNRPATATAAAAAAGAPAAANSQHQAARPGARAAAGARVAAAAAAAAAAAMTVALAAAAAAAPAFSAVFAHTHWDTSPYSGTHWKDRTRTAVKIILVVFLANHSYCDAYSNL